MYKNLFICTLLALGVSNVGHAATSGVFDSAAPARTAQAEALRGESLRELLFGFTDILSQEAQSQNDQSALLVAQGLQQDIRSLSHTALERMLKHAPPLSVLRERLNQARQLVDASHRFPEPIVASTRISGTPELNLIEFPEPRTTIPACTVITSTAALATFTSWGVVREILAGAKWECLETVFGENGSTACTAVNISMTAFEFVYKGEEACLTEQRDANLTAVIATQTNIAAHLNQFIDTTASSRASQASLDLVQANITQSLEQLNTLQQSLSNDLRDTELSLNDALSELARLANQLNSLSALNADIQFRLQENQVDIQDAQRRTADVQERSLEARADTQSLIATLAQIQAQLGQFDQRIQQRVTQQTRTQIAAALANSDQNIIRFQLPAAVGGGLEQAREIVAAAIIATENAGRPAELARTLLTRGEEAYNEANYYLAYGLFAQAYRSLLSSTQGIQP